MGDEGITFGEKVNNIYSDVRKILFDDKSKINGATKQPLLDLFAKLQAIATDTYAENLVLKERIANFGSIEKCISKGKSPTSYAQVLSGPPAVSASIPVRPGKRIVIKSKDSKLVDSEAVKKQFLDEIEEDKTFLRVTSVRKLKDKSLIVEVPSEGDLKMLTDTIASSRKLKSEEPSKIQPRIVIYDLPSETDEASLLEQFTNKNIKADPQNISKIHDFKILFKFKSKHANKLNFVVSLPGIFYKQISESGRVYFGFQRYRFSQFVSLTRCYKCQGYGHTSKVCNKKEDICGHCSENHKFENCPNKTKNAVCYHCKISGRDPNHDVRHKECPEFVRQTEFYKSKITYHD